MTKTVSDPSEWRNAGRSGEVIGNLLGEKVFKSMGIEPERLSRSDVYPTRTGLPAGCQHTFAPVGRLITSGFNERTGAT